MKKLIFILVAFLAFETNAQTTPSYPTVKLTKPATGAGTDDVLTIGSSKTINKVTKASLLSGTVPTSRTITINGTTLDLTQDREWTISSGGGSSIEPLQVDNTTKTVWNRGASNIQTNTSFGEDAFINNNTGVGNTVFGFWGLKDSVSGEFNTVFGGECLNHITSGINNVGIGYWAGSYNGDNGDWNTNSSDCIFIGRAALPLSNNSVNEIVIGNQTVGSGPNTATLGNISITKTILRGTINTTGLPTFADNAAATTGGLVVGDIYKTSTGDLKIVY